VKRRRESSLSRPTLGNTSIIAFYYITTIHHLIGIDFRLTRTLEDARKVMRTIFPRMRLSIMRYGLVKALFLLKPGTLLGNGFIKDVTGPRRSGLHNYMTESFRNPKSHTINGLECVEVTVTLPGVGDTTILEAAAKSQDVLVEMAIKEESENENRLLQGSDPYGAVLWPASQAVASYMLQNGMARGRHVLELGAGTGLVSIAALKAEAASVIAMDYEAVPLELLEFATRNLNGEQTRQGNLTTAQWNFCDFEAKLPQGIDIVVAADVMYEPAAGKAVACRVKEALDMGCDVLIGDSPGRAGRPAFLEQLRVLGLNEASFVSVVGSTVTGDRHELICGPTSTTVSDVPTDLEVAIMDLRHSSVT